MHAAARPAPAAPWYSALVAKLPESGAFDATVLAAADATATRVEGPAVPHRPDDRRASLDDLPGTSLRHFEVERLLGQGGMGSVFVGRDTSLDRKVALKVLDPEVSGEKELVARFVREARAQARLGHPNITQIYFVGEDRGFHFFAMELVEGRTLDDLLGEGRVPWPRAVEIAVAVSRGLRKALGQGYVHRDIKPSNLLIDADDQVKIADFGLVKSMEGDVELTREGVILGSPLYMSPEQGRSEAADHRSDVYSLGCVLYHMLTGALPFSGPTAVTIISKHVTDRARPIHREVPQVPPELEAIVERMMAKEPGKRHQTYDELIEDLEGVLPGRRPYSGLLSRGIAAAIDWGLVVGASFFLGPWAALVAAAYFVVLHRLLGRTLGKAILGLRVRNLGGRSVGWGASAVRFVVAVWGPALWSAAALVVYHTSRDVEVSFRLGELRPDELLLPGSLFGLLGLTILAYLGGLMVAAFHPQKRALHDLAAKTEVTSKRRR